MCMVYFIYDRLNIYIGIFIKFIYIFILPMHVDFLLIWSMFLIIYIKNYHLYSK